VPESTFATAYLRKTPFPAALPSSEDQITLALAPCKEEIRRLEALRVLWPKMAMIELPGLELLELIPCLKTAFGGDRFDIVCHAADAVG